MQRHNLGLFKIWMWDLYSHKQKRVEIAFYNVLRKIFVPKSEKSRSLEKQHENDFYKVCCVPNSRVNKPVRMRWPGHCNALRNYERTQYLSWITLNVRDH